MQSLTSIIDFFKIKHTCPICGNLLVRKLTSKFTDGNYLEYISDPKRDKYDYDNLVFIKFQEPTTEAILLKDEERDRIDGSPSIIDLQKSLPPSLHFLKFLDAYVSCYRKGICYHLWSEAPDFKPISERLVHDGKDLIITPKSISELSTRTEFPVSQNLILKYTPQETVNMFKKLMILQ